MPDELQTWATPLGVKLTVAGKGGPWQPITGHTAVPPANGKPLKLPLPHGVDAGWYYRNWRTADA